MTESDNWQLKCLKINQRGNVLLESEQWADCNFLVGEEGEEQVRFQCHKLLLSMASPVFEAMFYGKMAERKRRKPLIKILDIQPDVFKLLLHYIYTDTVDMKSSSWVNICGLWYAAKKYMLPHLETTCIDYLTTNIGPDNVCGIYEYSHVLNPLTTLVQKCIEIMRTRTKEVLSSRGFVEANLSTVVTLFSIDSLTISNELDLFVAAERYHKAQEETDSSDNQIVKNERVAVEKVSEVNVNQGKCNIRSVLEQIRFLTLTSEQFASGPANSTLLTESECYAILMNIVTATPKVPLPEGFSTSRISRELYCPNVKQRRLY